MPGTQKRLAGPTFLGSSVANVYTPPASTMQVLIKQIHVANTDTAPRTYTLYVGATGGSTAGTELTKDKVVAANSESDLYFPNGLPMNSTDFLTGLASVASKLVITVIGDQIVVP